MIVFSRVARIRILVPALLALTLPALLASGCGSGPPTATIRPAPTTTCERVTAVLSNGPDPQEDPVGYAQAQVLPLAHIHTADGRLGRAITTLDDAYRGLLTSKGTRGTRAAVTAAARRLDSYCPGAAP
jgi:hypothetical protein